MTQRRAQPRPIRRRRRARGVALMMVVAVIALASILGYTMLHTASLQNHAGTNQTKLLSADYLAESGVNIAMYYLQYPLEAPARNAEGYWSGMNADYTLPNGCPATLTVAVTQATDNTAAPPKAIPWTYEIAASASVGSAGEPTQRVTRTTAARVYVRNEYVMRPGAIVANNSITLYGPITANGDVYGSKLVGLKDGTYDPEVRGAAVSDNGIQVSGYLPPRDGFVKIHNPVAQSPIAPSNSNVNLYKIYSVDGEPYSAGLVQSVTNILTGLPGLLFPAPSESNPAGIIYKDATASPLVIEDNQTINGTLIVEGSLQIKGTNVTINPQPGYPALIVTGNLEIFQSGKNLTVNGITYVGGQLKSSGTRPALAELGSTLTVNGGLIFGSTSVSPIASSYNVTTTLNYNPTRAVAPELTPSPSLRRATGVSIVRWGMP